MAAATFDLLSGGAALAVTSSAATFGLVGGGSVIVTSNVSFDLDSGGSVTLFVSPATLDALFELDSGGSVLVRKTTGFELDSSGSVQIEVKDIFGLDSGGSAIVDVTIPVRFELDSTGSVVIDVIEHKATFELDAGTGSVVINDPIPTSACDTAAISGSANISPLFKKLFSIGTFTAPTAAYSIKLYDPTGNEISAPGYSPQTPPFGSLGWQTFTSTFACDGVGYGFTGVENKTDITFGPFQMATTVQSMAVVDSSGNKVFFVKHDKPTMYPAKSKIRIPAGSLRVGGDYII